MKVLINRERKTWCIYLLCLGIAALFISLLQPLTASHPTTTTEIRGVWLTNFGGAAPFFPRGINRALHQLAILNFNTVYPVVWNRGHTFYPSAVAKKATGRSQPTLLWMLNLGRDNLAKIAQQGKRQGLRIIPWFEYGFMTPANSELAKRHPNWLTYRYNGTKILKDDWNPQDVSDRNAKGQLPRRRAIIQQVWLNPLHPEVQQFILNLLVEVVTNYDITGIQLDDRFSLPVEFGYDPFTVKLYQQEHQGKNPPANYLDAQWRRWRANKMTDFMQRVFQAVKTVKPDCLVSLSPNPQYFAYSAYLQDWQTWVQRGLVDELVCQVYRNDLQTFMAELSQPALVMARHQIPVGIGILTGSWRHPIAISQIQQQVKVVRERGFAGVSFFYWESLWGYITPESPQKRKAAFKSLFSSSDNRQ